jgi:hypothetical protein
MRPDRSIGVIQCIRYLHVVPPSGIENMEYVGFNKHPARSYSLDWLIGMLKLKDETARHL